MEVLTMQSLITPYTPARAHNDIIVIVVE